MSSSRAETHGVRVEVEARYDPERSQPERSYWFFQYRIRIRNQRSDTIQLQSRHWRITDANGRTEEVRGAGVVGVQPVIEPGRCFEYTSGCPLPTPVGWMEGSYELTTAGGEPIEARIARFELAHPHAIH